MQVTFIDAEENWKQMLPMSYTRPVADVRVGILKIHEKWAKYLDISNTYFRSQPYLSELFETPKNQTLTIRGNVLPEPNLIAAIKELKEDEVLTCNDTLIAGYFEPNDSFEADGQKGSINRANNTSRISVGHF